MKFPPVYREQLETSQFDHAQDHVITNIDNRASEEVITSTSTCFDNCTSIYESFHSRSLGFKCCHGSDVYSNNFARRGDPCSDQVIEDVGLNNNNNIM